MLKKLLFAGLAAGVVGGVVVGTNSLSYIRTTAGVIKDEISGQIPIEFEIKRAEKLIDEIIPEVQACRKVVAQEEVEVEYLRDEISHLGELQEKNEKRISVQRTSLERPAAYYTFAGKRYSRVEVQSDLERTFSDFKDKETLIESKRRLLQARSDSLIAAKSKLENVKIEKAKMENMVQSLYAQLRQLQAVEASGTRFALNDTNLTEAKKLLTSCKKRLDVAQKMIESESLSISGIEIDSPAPRDVLAEVDAYFANRTVAPEVEGAAEVDLTASR